MPEIAGRDNGHQRSNFNEGKLGPGLRRGDGLKTNPWYGI